jgi:predicted dehydrogenase
MLNIGIIGTGGMAAAHANAYQAVKGVKITSCCDIFEDKAKAFAEKFQIGRWYGDFKRMLAEEKLDGVSIVSTDATHAKISIAALERGIPVLCEKPMAVTVTEAEEMLKAAKKAGVISMINFSKRNSSGLQAAKKHIAQGKIGRIMHVDAQYLQSWLTTKHWGDWRTGSAWLWRLSTRHGSGGVLGDIGCHIYDMAGFLCGDIEDIYCALKTYPKAKGDKIGEYVLDANDSFVSTVTFKNGALGTVHCSRWATGHCNREYICVYGDKGAVEVDFEKGMSLYRRYDSASDVWETIGCKRTPSNYERFIAAIKTGKNDASDFENGIKIQKYLHASFVSDKMGKPVKLEY